MVRLDAGHGVAAAGAGDLEPGLDRLVGGAAVSLVLVWIWLNPRVFPEPRAISMPG
jgi:hypothetical protein